MAGGKKDLTPSGQAMSDAKHVVEHTLGEKLVHGAAHAMAKSAPVATKVVGGAIGRVLPAVAGGVPGGLVAAFSGNTGRGFNEMQKNRNDMLSTDVASQRAMMYRNTPKLNMTKKMVTVKSPAYSGQSTMGKALMASAKKKV